MKHTFLGDSKDIWIHLVFTTKDLAQHSRNQNRACDSTRRGGMLPRRAQRKILLISLTGRKKSEPVGWVELVKPNNKASDAIHSNVQI